MTWPPARTSTSSPTRAGDDDREHALELLREHWMAGRLTLAEYEDRCDEVAAARFISDLEQAVRELPLAPPPPPDVPEASSGVSIASCVLGVTALVMLLVTFGIAAILTLPMSATAWALGRRGRRHGSPSSRSFAVAGEVTGIVGTAMSVLFVSACAMIVSSF